MLIQYYIKKVGHQNKSAVWKYDYIKYLIIWEKIPKYNPRERKVNPASGHKEGNDVDTGRRGAEFRLSKFKAIKYIIYL